jgi:hypothetical protein
LAVISSSESKIQGTKIIKILLEQGGNLNYVEYLGGLLVKVSFLQNESAAIFCCINKFGIAVSKWKKILPTKQICSLCSTIKASVKQQQKNEDHYVKWLTCKHK